MIKRRRTPAERQRRYRRRRALELHLFQLGLPPDRLADLVAYGWIGPHEVADTDRVEAVLFALVERALDEGLAPDGDDVTGADSDRARSRT